METITLITWLTATIITGYYQFKVVKLWDIPMPGFNKGLVIGALLNIACIYVFIYILQWHWLCIICSLISTFGSIYNYYQTKKLLS